MASRYTELSEAAVALEEAVGHFAPPIGRTGSFWPSLAIADRSRSGFGPLGQFKRIIKFNPEVADSALDLGVTEQ